MKLSLNSSTIKTTPILDKIRVAGEAGYEGIELWAIEIYEHIGRGGEVSDLEKALADHGLEVPCFIAVRNWGETEGWEYKLALDEARRRFELAARFNCPYMVCTPPLEQPGIDNLHKGYADLLQIGRETGVRAVLEYISFFESLNNVPDAVKTGFRREIPPRSTAVSTPCDSFTEAVPNRSTWRRMPVRLDTLERILLFAEGSRNRGTLRIHRPS